MKTKIQKWGNSLGVRLPKSIADQKDLKAGLGVSVLIQDNKIVIEPIAEEMSLDSIMASVTPNNLHAETDWNEARGNEVW